MNLAHVEINEQFARALELMGAGAGHVFVTGRAGTGKSTLLEYFREQSKKKIVVLAPTGVAAVNIGGQTVHSFFRFKPDITIEKAERAARKVAGKKGGEIYKKLDAIVIDEISMVRADLFDCIDRFLRIAREKQKIPFGGARLIMIGDLYQLPPVVTSAERHIFSEHYPSPYFFDAHIFSEMAFELVELTKVYRQRDERFIGLLNAIRNRTVTEDDLDALNARYQPDFIPGDDYYIHLTPFNASAADVNRERLGQLKGRARIYQAESMGDFKRDSYPAEERLSLKKGAQVMLVNNDSLGRWVNGTIAEVTAMESDAVEVRLPSGEREWVEPSTWELFHFEMAPNGRSIVSNPVGAFTQIPLKLAWAVTIHKAQGKTFDRVVVDLGRGTFAPGQLYVALSRCTSLEGLVLKTKLKKTHAMVDYRVMKFLTQYHYDRSEEASPLEEKRRLIEAAIEAGDKLAITYLKASDEKSHRVIEPSEVGEMEFKGFPFIGMTGYCLKRRDKRVFRVDRILKMEVLRSGK